MTSAPVTSPSFINRLAEMGSRLMTSVRGSAEPSAPSAPKDEYAGTPQQCRGIRDSESAGPQALADCIRSAMG